MDSWVKEAKKYSSIQKRLTSFYTPKTGNIVEIASSFLFMKVFKSKNNKGDYNKRKQSKKSVLQWRKACFNKTQKCGPNFDLFRSCFSRNIFEVKIGDQVPLANLDMQLHCFHL